ncbi:calmodulin-binding transcription activator 5 [Tanacetum coccineum]
MQQIFTINEVSPSWASSTEDTKILVVGVFHEEYLHLANSNLFCVCGDVSVPVEVIQSGVFRCYLSSQSPGIVNLFISFDGHKPISQLVAFEYRAPPVQNLIVSSEEKSDWKDFQNRLLEWLLERILEGHKIPDRDDEGQGAFVILAVSHLYRRKSVASLLSAGANPNLVTDPTSENPGGCTPADLASKSGYEGLSAYLAEKALLAHFEAMTLAGNEDYFTAHIQAAFREQSLKLKSKAVEFANAEDEAHYRQVMHNGYGSGKTLMHECKLECRCLKRQEHKDLRILFWDRDGKRTNSTTNVVSKEALF